MKTTLFVVCLLLTAAASAQTAGYLTGPSMNNSVQIYDHASFATRHDLASEKSLISGSQYTWAQGERPVWEFAHPDESKPLGDIARELKKEHANAKKAAVVHTN